MANELKSKKYLTILPLGVLNGHAEEYSKPVFGSITGCSPITPIPLEAEERKHNKKKRWRISHDSWEALKHQKKLTRHSQFSHCHQ